MEGYARPLAEPLIDGGLEERAEASPGGCELRVRPRNKSNKSKA